MNKQNHRMKLWHKSDQPHILLKIKIQLLQIQNISSTPFNTEGKNTNRHST